MCLFTIFLKTFMEKKNGQHFSHGYAVIDTDGDKLKISHTGDGYEMVAS